MKVGGVSGPLCRQPRSRRRRLTKERHAGRVDGLEFSQVLLEVVLAQLHSLFQEFPFSFWYCLCGFFLFFLKKRVKFRERRVDPSVEHITKTQSEQRNESTVDEERFPVTADKDF